MRRALGRAGLVATAVAALLTLVRLALERPVADAYDYAVKQVPFASLLHAAVAMAAATLVLVGARRHWAWVWAALAAAAPVTLAALAPGLWASLRVVAKGTPWPIVALDAAEALALLGWATAVLAFAALQVWKRTPQTEASA